MIRQVIKGVREWSDFIKFPHTVFALPFGLGAMVVAARENHGWPGIRTFLLILAAMVTARSCAMSFNRIVDQRYDAMNPRTADWQLPAGRIKLSAAITFCAANALAFVFICYWINSLCFLLSPVALFVICFYSFTKRFTHFSHFFLGLSLGIAPVGAWLAVRGTEVTTIELVQMGLLALAVVFWVVGFDVIYALQDYEFDCTHGLKSLVVLLGPERVLDVSFVSHIVMILLLAAFGVLCGFRLGYFGGWVIISCCLFMEHWIARHRSKNWIQTAFFKLNALISTVFFVSTLAEVVFRGGFRLWDPN